MSFIIYHCNSVEAFSPLKHYCFKVSFTVLKKVLSAVMHIMCGMGNKL